MGNELLNFIQTNSPDGGFLQSEYWRNFQESYGRKTFKLEEKDEDGDTLIYAYVIAHKLPVVGDYFYVPRGPVGRNPKSEILNPKQYQIPHTTYQNFLDRLLKLAKENNVSWIRIEPNNEEEFKLVKENLPNGLKMKKAPVDMQPREILVIDILKGEEEILAGMKQKTRYNIRLAEKRGVRVSHNMEHGTWNRKHIEEFLRLVKITSKRDKIKAHSESYYRKMFEVIPREILKLYVADYKGKIIVANLVLFFGKTATYMHGASDNIHREVMAPYLLQWQAILDAKKMGCTEYDLGGINTKYKIPDTRYKNWEGITKFKTGFVPEAKPIEFPGCWDIVLSPSKYWLYKILRKIKP